MATKASANAPSLRDLLGDFELTWAQTKALAEYLVVPFNGDTAPINRVLGRRGIKAIVLIEPYGAGSTPSRLPSMSA